LGRQIPPLAVPSSLLFSAPSASTLWIPAAGRPGSMREGAGFDAVANHTDVFAQDVKLVGKRQRRLDVIDRLLDVVQALDDLATPLRRELAEHVALDRHQRAVPAVDARA